MTKGSRQNDNQMDQCVVSVLNSIFHISRIDPEWIQPDCSFDKDLEMTREQVLAIGRFALNELGLKHTNLDITHLSSSRTPRELVSLIKKIVEESMTKAA